MALIIEPAMVLISDKLHSIKILEGLLSTHMFWLFLTVNIEYFGETSTPPNFDNKP